MICRLCRKTIDDTSVTAVWVLTLRGLLITIRAFLTEAYSALAQLVEQMTVNQWVAGSSPAGGAI